MQYYITWVVASTAAFHARVRGSLPGLGGLKEISIFESCVWRAESFHSSNHPQEVLLAQFHLYVHKSGLNHDSFHFTIITNFTNSLLIIDVICIESKIYLNQTCASCSSLITFCIMHSLFSLVNIVNTHELVCLTLWPPNYSIWIFTHLKLCLADAIHNFKWVKIIQIWQNVGQLFSNIADWCHILFKTCLKAGTKCANKKCKPEYIRHRRLKG